MSFTGIVEALRGAFGDAIKKVVEDKGDPWVEVEASRLLEVARFLRDDAATALDHLSLVSGVDYPKLKTLEVVYHLDSIARNTRFVLKVLTDRNAARVPTLTGLYATADWHEREVFDLSGVHFDGHPNLTRILCADDWVGHPLRKDYEWPKEYHGVPCGPFAGDGVNIPPEWELEGFTTKKSTKA